MILCGISAEVGLEPVKMYSWIKYGCRYYTQGILGNIPIIVIMHSYMVYLRLFINIRKMLKLITNLHNSNGRSSIHAKQIIFMIVNGRIKNETFYF